MFAAYPTPSWKPSSRARASAELERRRRDRARLPFGDWLRMATPSYTWDVPHLLHIQAVLDRVTRGELKRVMLFLPPRHGKSEQVTVRYPVWRMMREPTMNVIVAAYNQSLAESFSRKSRSLAREYLSLNDDRKAANEWMTDEGGTFRAVGVGGGVTGRGSSLLLLDDPVKSREEANSAAYRDRVWNWYRDDLYTRLEPDAQMIVIQTRWHENDLAGRILESEDAASWHVVNLPALAEDDDALGRKPGAALWPERFDEDDLERIRTVLGTPSFTALYQQRPTALEGGMFKRDWFEMVNIAPRAANRVRYWDKAATLDDGDYTCGVLMARDGAGTFYVEDVVRGRWSTLERERIIRQTAEMDKATYTGFGGVAIWMEQEPGSGGKESAEATVRALAGHSVYAERVQGDKATRAEPLAAQCEARNVKLVAGPWNAAYLDELTMFPNGRHDDQVDATTGAFARLASGPRRRARSREY
jgi:predicted phage terminase large subunit-like protein